jgi:hypothetical protein
MENFIAGNAAIRAAGSMAIGCCYVSSAAFLVRTLVLPAIAIVPPLTGCLRHDRGQGGWPPYLPAPTASPLRRPPDIPGHREDGGTAYPIRTF